MTEAMPPRAEERDATTRAVIRVMLFVSALAAALAGVLPWAEIGDASTPASGRETILMLVVAGMLFAAGVIGPGRRAARWIILLSTAVAIVLTIRGLLWIPTIDGADLSDIGRGLVAAGLASVLSAVATTLAWRRGRRVPEVASHS
jgi:hypothetical protein